MRRLAMLAILACSGSLHAETHCATGSPAIPDGSGSVVWTVEAPATDRIITQVLLLTRIDHPWVGDLSVRLTAPDGTSVRLLDRPGMPSSDWIGPWGCGGDDIVCLFDDLAGAAAESTCSLDAVPVLDGNLRPLESLSVFHGTIPSGVWSIEVTDHSFIDAGTIDQLCLTYTTAPDCNGNGIPDTADIDAGDSNDADGNGVPDECQCSGDTNGDLVVNVSDLLRVLEEWGCTQDCTADLNGDSNVDVTDLLSVIGGWGSCR
ncbi:MAG: proprotein convertase P-domain-containing protein [Planctomycetota bacterium]|nr:proprotein convertase P-domain-containing protein [Planctomycetota bacterium]